MAKLIDATNDGTQNQTYADTLRNDTLFVPYQNGDFGHANWNNYDDKKFKSGRGTDCSGGPNMALYEMGYTFVKNLSDTSANGMMNNYLNGLGHKVSQSQANTGTAVFLLDEEGHATHEETVYSRNEQNKMTIITTASQNSSSPATEYENKNGYYTTSEVAEVKTIKGWSGNTQRYAHGMTVLRDEAAFNGYMMGHKLVADKVFINIDWVNMNVRQFDVVIAAVNALPRRQ